MKKLIFLIVGLFFLANTLFGYEVVVDKSLPLPLPLVVKRKTFDDGNAANAIIKANGGYLIVGYTESFGTNNRKEAWIIKINEYGHKLWSRTFRDGSENIAKAITKANGGYLVVGYTKSFSLGANKDIWILKIDENGNKLWSKTLFWSNYKYEAKAIIKTDGGYLIVGYTYFWGGGQEAWIIRINEYGHKLWSKTFGGRDYGEAKAIIKADSGYLVAGSIGFGKKAWILKIDKDGNKLWSKTFVGRLRGEANAIIKVDSGYIVVGNTPGSFGVGDTDAWIIKIDKDGNKLWSKTFGGKNLDVAYAITKVDNGYLISGYTYSNKTDNWIIKINEYGHKLWYKIFGSGYYTHQNFATIKADNGYLVAGNTKYSKAFIIKLEESNLNLNDVIKNYIKEKIASIPKPPKEKKLVKDEFETTKEFQQRVKKEKAKLKKEVKKYNKEIARVIKNKKEAIKVALQKLWGKPIIENLRYDADNGYFIGKLRFENKDFKKNIAIKVPRKIARGFKKSFSSLKPKAVFEYDGKSVSLKRVVVPYSKNWYLAQFTDYDLDSTRVAVNISNEFSIDTTVSANIKTEKPRVSSLDISKLRDFGELDRELTKAIKAKVDPKKWLFVVGIEQYEFTDNIKYARRSALMFKKVMKKVLGIDESHCFTMIDDKATSSIVKTRFKKMLRRVKKGDTIYFYYNGHGIPVANRKFEPFMLATDVEPDFVSDDSFFALKNIYAKLSQSKARKVVVIVDSCFSGITDGKSIIKGVAATKLKPKFVEFDKNKMVVLSAGKSHQYSNGYDKKGYRLFSYYIMKNILKGDREIRKLYLDTKNMTYKTSLEEYGDLRVQEPSIEGNFKMGL